MNIDLCTYKDDPDDPEFTPVLGRPGCLHVCELCTRLRLQLRLQLRPPFIFFLLQLINISSEAATCGYFYKIELQKPNLRFFLFFFPQHPR